MIETLITIAAAGGASIFGYLKTRGFVRSRLRFVDAVQKPVAPIIAGSVAALAAAPVVALLPLVGAGTAVLFGIGIGTGVAHGARDTRRLPPVWHS